MELKKNIDFLILGLSGSILLILSEFLLWFSDYSLINLFIIAEEVEIDYSFILLFPFVSGIICLIANTLIIYDFRLKIKSVLITIIGLGFLIIFIVDYLYLEFDFLLDAGIGFYLFLIGFLLIDINLANILLTKE